MWPNASLLTSSVPVPRSLVPPCILHSPAQQALTSLLVTAEFLGGPWRLTVAAGVPHSAEEFAKELCCSYKHWSPASVSSSLYLETMEESWPAGCPEGGPGYALSTLLLSEPLLKCQPAILPLKGRSLLYSGRLMACKGLG